MTIGPTHFGTRSNVDSAVVCEKMTFVDDLFPIVILPVIQKNRM